MTALHRLRAWLLKREAKRLMQRAIAGKHIQSSWQTGGQQQSEILPEFYGSTWFALVAIVTAFGAGYVVADDKRIERDQQDQVDALCAKPWPDAPGTAAARRRVCSRRH